MMASGPGPVHKIVCSECGQDWGAHMQLAGEYSVGYEHCVTLLKQANQGPPGPPGPTGPMGPQGPSDDSWHRPIGGPAL